MRITLRVFHCWSSFVTINSPTEAFKLELNEPIHIEEILERQVCANSCSKRQAIRFNDGAD